ncbi:hypothetical protein AWB91_24890 [Mycobacterium paraense]|uniref:Transmembrane protein n=1 Tax=Mycobacterium paraense TaxID=767916 RepID=A0A1X2A8N2_9MYCO|nr:hypothetical protein [Mycobacterium paraense]ORW29258.1 hypothetical protein AWB91_24890 [Mycobacterium paraense]ORW40417.1 hypothetical protein AWB88_13895 [Mycobacterium paraense]ORW44271.1 hypothetical protein AWB90_17320 [Mycobacterium paraense]
MIGRYRAFVELALACAALVGAGFTWVHARHTVSVAPIADGQPVTTSLVYEPQLLLLTLVLVTAAGVLAVVGIARLLRARGAEKATPSS